MIVDIYKRSETEGQFSYLAVPEGKDLPEEVTGTEWEPVEKGVEFDDAADLQKFSIESPSEQINAKGYAITSSEKFIAAR